MRGYLTAANCDNDFNFVALGQQALREQTARYDLAVALDRDTFSGKIQKGNQLGNADRVLESLWRAVDAD